MTTVQIPIHRWLRGLGPGIITGASHDDPSGIATYTQAGARFGYGQLWTALYMLPSLYVVQEACGRIGAVTGKGLVAIAREHYSRTVVSAVILLVLVANTISIGADLGAMAAATNLLLPVDGTVLVMVFTAGILTLELYSSYTAYARVLRWLVLSLLSYPLTVLIAKQPWHEVIRATFIPHVEWSSSFCFIITGVLGTTISPYMFFWQAAQEVEEEKQHNLTDARGHPRISRAFIRTVRVDTAIGMVISEVTTWSIIVVAATVLHTGGITTLRTAADAARALEPLVQTFPHAGFLAKVLFAVGVIGLGLLAVPVESGATAYAFAEAWEWPEGLRLKLRQAPGFYGVIAIATLVGLGINLVGLDPVRVLIIAAVVNGVAAAPLLLLIARIAENGTVMGPYRSGWRSSLGVWLTLVAMGAAAVAMLVTLGTRR